MGLTWRDGAATLVMAAVAVLYGAFLAGSDLPLLSAPRVLALIFLALGIVAFVIGATDLPKIAADPGTDLRANFFAGLGTITLIDAIAVMLTGSELFLSVLVGMLGVIWLLTTLRHAWATVAGHRGRTPAARG